jgi:hypothetical protein
MKEKLKDTENELRKLDYLKKKKKCSRKVVQGGYHISEVAGDMVSLRIVAVKLLL